MSAIREGDLFKKRDSRNQFTVHHVWIELVDNKPGLAFGWVIGYENGVVKEYSMNDFAAHFERV